MVNDANLVSGCRVLGTVADNEVQDLQKKAAPWAETSRS
jgi:hypothetical protein